MAASGGMAQDRRLRSARRRSALVLALTVGLVCIVSGLSVNAQTPTTTPEPTTAPGDPAPTAPPSTEPPPPPPPSTEPPAITTPPLLPTTTTVAPTTVPPAATTVPATTVPPAPGPNTSTTRSGPAPIPPDVQALINSIKRSGASSTTKLLEALKPLEEFGLTPQEAAIVGMGRFPVAGNAAFSDDWLMPRSGPPFHLHQGNDIFAAMNVPVLAPDDGVFRSTDGGLGGLGAYVTTADGTFYYLAHLSSIVKGLASGTRVKRGQVIAFNGNSGNASGGAPHVHFEIHPKGGAAINPKPHLDAWLNEALAAVPALIARYRGSAPPVIINTGLTRRFDQSGGMFSAPPRFGAAPLLWASSVTGAGGSLRLAEASAEGEAGGIDWARRAEEEQVAIAAWHEADAEARELLAPLTPGALAGLL